MVRDSEVIDKLFREEFRKIVSVLTKTFGLDHLEIAEDIASDTFLIASENWKLKGLPDNPTAWLYLVAKNKTRDYIKKQNIFTNKIVAELQKDEVISEDLILDLSPKNISDSQLQMMFAICNPIISIESQIGLALRILCGFGIEEIANAFLTNKETINKRLFRAKEKLRIENVKIEFPNENEIVKRLEAVISTIYLVFNEGYNSVDNLTIKNSFSQEAMRLNLLLLENELTQKPFVFASMALMCFHASRFEARKNANGELILYEDQDFELWNNELIIRGEYYLNKASKGNEISKYHLEAAIAFWHTQKNSDDLKWKNILQLYNRLLQIEYSPITALNRTFALAKADSIENAIKEAEKLNLTSNHYYHSLLGNLYETINEKKALFHLQLAEKLVINNQEKNYISKKIKEIKSKHQ